VRRGLPTFALAVCLTVSPGIGHARGGRLVAEIVSCMAKAAKNAVEAVVEALTKETAIPEKQASKLAHAFVEYARRQGWDGATNPSNADAMEALYAICVDEGADRAARDGAFWLIATADDLDTGGLPRGVREGVTQLRHSLPATMMRTYPAFFSGGATIEVKRLRFNGRTLLIPHDEGRLVRDIAPALRKHTGRSIDVQRMVLPPELRLEFWLFVQLGRGTAEQKALFAEYFGSCDELSRRRGDRDPPLLWTRIYESLADLEQGDHLPGRPRGADSLRRAHADIWRLLLRRTDSFRNHPPWWDQRRPDGERIASLLRSMSAADPPTSEALYCVLKRIYPNGPPDSLFRAAASDQLLTVVVKRLRRGHEDLPMSALYSYHRKSDDRIAIAWQEDALALVAKLCDRRAARKQLRKEVSRLGRIERLSGKDRGSWLYREIVIEAVNRNLVPSFGIVEISFSNPTSSNDAIGLEVSLRSVCGYTVSYNILECSLVPKGAHIK